MKTGAELNALPEAALGDDPVMLDHVINGQVLTLRLPRNGDTVPLNPADERYAMFTAEHGEIYVTALHGDRLVKVRAFVPGTDRSER